MKKLTPSRYPSRSTTSEALIREVLDQSLYCTISYCAAGRPYALPTGFCVHNDQLIVHGSVKSHFLEALLKAEKVCITTFLFDGLVLAASAFEHSVNYRSVVIFSNAVEIEDPETKAKTLEAFTEKYLPGRWPHLRPMTEGEMNATKVLAFDLDHASLKERSGPPGKNNDEWQQKVWMGVLPASLSYGQPLPFDGQPTMPVPEHVEKVLKKYP